MAERTLDLRPRIEPNHLRQIENEVDRLGPDDRLVLVLERQDAHQTRPIAELLHRKGIGWQPQGSHEGVHTITVGREFTRPRGPDTDDPPGNTEGWEEDRPTTGP